MENKSYHMPWDDFRRLGHDLVDWIADYHEKVASYPVFSQARPGDIRSRLPKEPPQQGENLQAVIQDLNDIILHGITHWQSPNFFAFFPANTSAPSILGELVSAGLGVQGMLWATSPACTELETHLMDWLVDMLALPAHFKSTAIGGGVIQDTASTAVLCAIIAARERINHSRSNEIGCDGRLVAYASSQTHSSVEKAVKIAGIGHANLRAVDTDESLAMRPDSLRTLIEEDRRQGRVPFFVCATVGTTSTNAMDPLRAIGAVARDFGLWMHVDGAMSGTAALCPEYRHFQDGLELASSYSFNPHKWMFTNFDCDCFFVADRKPLIQALSILPEYLRNQATESGAVIDYRDWQVALGRRFRALKLWFVIRHYGIEGLQHHIRRHIELAQKFAGWIEKEKDWELTFQPPLNLVCFRHRHGDEFNRRLLEAVNGSGKIYITHSKVNDRFILRLCVGQTHTDEENVKMAWDIIRQTASRLQAEM